MMRRPPYNRYYYLGSITEKLKCLSCSKLFPRTFYAESAREARNPDGETYTIDIDELQLDTFLKATSYCEKEKANFICRWCGEKTFREALIRFHDGDAVPAEDWVLRTLVERKHLQYEFSDCESCGQKKWNTPEYYLTKKGIQRAIDLKKESIAKGEYPYV
jgi:hypothetical protein